MAESAALRIAFVGTGQMARAHVGALKRVAVAHSIGAAYDNSDTRARSFAAATGVTPWASLREMLQEYRPNIVHVLTPRGRHFEPALEALRAGAHIYVEKPFAESSAEARSLLDVARLNGLTVCAGHQLLYDPAYQALTQTMRHLGKVIQVDSNFAFRPEPRLSRLALTNMLADILPHPLYSLMAAMEAAGAASEDIQIASLYSGPEDLHAILQAGDLTGRLSVTLRGRPVASTLTVLTEGGSVTADFIRTTIVGARNPGLSPLEKIFNPIIEGWQQISRTGPAILRRITSGISYPGLSELITAFYRSVAAGQASPILPAHLLRVTALYQEMVEHLTADSHPGRQTVPLSAVSDAAPMAVVTGARGFLGRHVAQHLTERGYRVRGISRSPDHDHPHVHEWFRADLAQGVSADAFAGADVVVHAAAETAGGFEEHQRNSIDATSAVLRGMQLAGVNRLVYVSSLSVLEPAGAPWKQLDEDSPLARAPRRLGAYAWGKTEAERQLAGEAERRGVELRIIRPAALIDLTTPELPGLVGRRLFGAWHLGLGRPSLPIAALSVDRCGEVIAWCATNFSRAPRAVNLFDPGIASRKELLDLFRSSGWKGRMVWVPISVVVGGFVMARTLMSLAKGQRPEPLDVWSVLRPQRYDPSASQSLLQGLERDNAPAVHEGAMLVA
jgi:predicted dehydrogenase/nucleoside-diphosphate-sugar epimerase